MERNGSTSWQQRQLEIAQKRIRDMQAQQQASAQSTSSQFSYGAPTSSFAGLYGQQGAGPAQPFPYPAYGAGQQWSKPAGGSRPAAVNSYGAMPPPPPPRRIAPATGKGLSLAELMAKAKENAIVVEVPPPPPPAAVQARHPAPDPSPPPSSLTMVAPKYPRSLLQFVERSFDQCTTPLQKQEVQRQLKVRIATATSAGTMWTMDWSSQPMPILIPAPLPSKPIPSGASILPQPPTLSGPNQLPAGSSSSPNRYPMSQMTRPSPAVLLVATPTKRKAEAKLSQKQLKKLRKQQANAAKLAEQQLLMEAKAVPEPRKSFNLSEGQREALLTDPAVGLRAKRFNTDTKKSVALSTSKASSNRPIIVRPVPHGDGDIDLDWEALKICGTCQELEKKFLRLTSAPDPSTVRPLSVLRESLSHIRSIWNNDRHYFFFCEQLKSLRQDLTIQHIIEQFTIDVYELNARVCIEVDDLSEFNQCQTQLISLYGDVPGNHPNRDEFVSYRFYYLMMTNDMTSIALLLKDNQQHVKSPLISQALSILFSIRHHDYVAFFRECAKTPPLAQNIIRHLFPGVRYRALQRLVTCCRPTISIASVAEILGFQEGEDRAFETFLRQSGAVVNSASRTITCKDSVIVKASEVDEEERDYGVTHGLF